MMDLIVSWLCSAIAEAMEWVVETLCSAFGYDISTFNKTFNFAATAYDIILSTALPLALILAAWSIIVFFWKGADKAPSTPIRTVINLVVAIAFIYYGNNLFEAILDFCQYPYDALLGKDAATWGVPIKGIFSKTGLVANVFAGVSSLVYLIMLLMIGISFIKLLLEIVERYVVTFVLMYLSPLAAATLASSTTSGIYKKFFTMFVSQCVLIFLNAWCLKMAVSGLSLSSSDNPVIISLLLCFAFLKVAARMDSYLNQIGLNSAITGGGMGAEIMGAGAAMFNRGGNGGGGGNGAGGAGSKILGASKSVGTWMQRVSPMAAAGKTVTDTVSGAVKGGSEAFRSGAVGNAKRWGKVGAAVKGTLEGAKSGFIHSDNGISNLATSSDARSGIRRAENAVDKALHGDNAKERPDFKPGFREKRNENASVDEIAVSESRANDIFTYASHGGTSITGQDNNDRVAAVMKGIGLDKHSKETAESINAGFGRDGAKNQQFSLTEKGIHNEYDLNGYRHKTDVVNASQYKALSAQEKAGFEKWSSPSGSKYYVRNTKTLHEKPASDNQETKDTKTNSKSAESTPPNNDASNATSD